MDVVSNLSPREHVEFVRERDVAWTAFDPLGSPAERRVKYVTKGTESAAFSGLLRYPTGFEAPFGAHARQIELFVLDGMLSIGDIDCGPNAYIFVPGDFVPGDVGYGPVVARDDTTVLAHYEGLGDLVEPSSGALEELDDIRELTRLFLPSP